MRKYPFGPSDRLQLHPQYAELREHEPLGPVRMPHGEDAWIVVRCDDVRKVLSDPRFGRAATTEHDELAR